MESPSFKRFFSPSRLLQQKTTITVENDIVAGDVLLCLRGNFLRFLRIDQKWSPYVRFVLLKSRQRIAAIRAGSKMGCVELSNFHFCCAAIFCQPMKKFEFFGATRATRQRHSKTSSTGDEDAFALIVSAHPYCARKSTCHVMPRHASSARAKC